MRKTILIPVTSTIRPLQNVIKRGKKSFKEEEMDRARKTYSRSGRHNMAKVNFLYSEFICLFTSMMLLIRNRSSTFSFFSRGK